jgi:hypothetical protein
MTTKQTIKPITDSSFEQKVTKFCQTAAKPIVQLYGVEDDYPDRQGDTLRELLTSLPALGISIEIVQKPDTSTEEQGAYRCTAMVLMFSAANQQDIYVKILCDLSSYGGLTYISHKLVKAVTKTVQVFE